MPGAVRMMAGRRPDRWTLGEARPPLFLLLTAREREVQLAALGNSNQEIAAGLSISVLTVETHRKKIMDKLGLHGTADLILYAVRKGWCCRRRTPGTPARDSRRLMTVSERRRVAVGRKKRKRGDHRRQESEGTSRWAAADLGVSFVVGTRPTQYFEKDRVATVASRSLMAAS